MGLLQRIEDGLVLSLGKRCLVGRARHCALRIDDSIVSAEHAALYFSGEQWKVRDLASTNGTYLGGTRVTAGASHPLTEMSELGFGSATATWRLLDASRPGPSARSAEGHIHGVGGALWLPTATDPEASIFVEDGQWLADTSTGSTPVGNGTTLDVGGTNWVLELPPPDGEDEISTCRTDTSDPTEGLSLRFAVSTDEEHVSVEATYRGSSIPLGARAHHYALLLLARHRLAEAPHLPSAGWIYTDELRDMLGIDREGLNLLLWRAKQQFRQSGLPAESLIERRTDTHQLRLGIENVECGPQ